MSTLSKCVCFIILLAAARGYGQAIPPDAGLPVIDWKDAGKYLDKQVIVQGKIVQTKNIGRITFLNFDTARTFTAIVHEPCYKNFSTPPEKLYDQKLVRIRGTISEYQGRLEIQLCKPDQVAVVEQIEPPPPKPAPKPRQFDGTVTIATYNVLNLFDDYDDPYHDDEGTPAKPKEQLEKLAATIHALDADVLALQEIESEGYLERFAAAMLGDMGYEHVVCFESNDRRGIDCALLSRFPVGPVTSHRYVRFKDGQGAEIGFRRDLLQVQIEPPGCPPFTVFVVHLKSKRGEDGPSDTIRIAEATQVRKVLDGLIRQNKDSLFVICGDFNDTWDSKPMKTLRGEGPGALKDFLADLAKGTITYNAEPKSMIDFILASPGMAKHYAAKSCRVISGTIESSGSDHNPVSARFELKGD